MYVLTMKNIPKQIMIKLHQGLNYRGEGWLDVIKSCNRVCNDVHPSLVTKEALHMIELEILFAVNFNLVPIGGIFGGVKENGENELTWKFAEARLFRGESPEDGGIPLAAPVERINQCVGLAVTCSTVREAQIFHHWSMYCMVEAAHDAVMATIYKEFSCARLPEFPALDAVRMRFADMATRDHVMAQTLARYCLMWYKCPNTVVSGADLAALEISGRTMTDVSVL